MPITKIIIHEGFDILAYKTIPNILEGKTITTLLKEFSNVYC
jgi:S-methylmethionine-dependent homocysteine/selenocysteine methylase